MMHSQSAPAAAGGTAASAGCMPSSGGCSRLAAGRGLPDDITLATAIRLWLALIDLRFHAPRPGCCQSCQDGKRLRRRWLTGWRWLTDSHWRLMPPRLGC